LANQGDKGKKPSSSMQNR